jgi:hypothetical protein
MREVCAAACIVYYNRFCAAERVTVEKKINNTPKGATDAGVFDVVARERRCSQAVSKTKLGRATRTRPLITKRIFSPERAKVLYLYGSNGLVFLLWVVLREKKGTVG